jgi:hypothetical protein
VSRAVTILAAFLLLVAAGFFLSDAPPPPPAPPPAAPSSPSPEPPPAADPSGFPSAAASELVAMMGRVEKVTLDDPELGTLRDPDPRAYGRRLRSLPAYRALRDWLTAEPRELTAAQRQALEAVDEAFRGESLLAPFAPFLEAAPAPEGGVLAKLPGGEVFRARHSPSMKADGFPVGPWGRAAGEATIEAYRANEELDQRLGSDPGKVLGMDHKENVSMLGFLSTEGKLQGLLRESGPRLRFAQIARESVGLRRRSLVLTMRALQHAEQPDRMASLLSRMVSHNGITFFSELADLELLELLGREPRTPAECLFAAAVRREVAFGTEALGGKMLSGMRSMLPLAVRASVDEPSRPDEKGNGSQWRGIAGRYFWVEGLIRLGDVAGMRALIEAQAGRLRRSPGGFGWPALRKLASYQRDHRGRPGEDLGAEAQAVLVASLERMVKTHAGRRPAKKAEEILRGLR